MLGRRTQVRLRQAEDPLEPLVSTVFAIVRAQAHRKKTPASKGLNQLVAQLLTRTKGVSVHCVARV